MDEAVLIMSGLEPEDVVRAVDVVTIQHTKHQRKFRKANDYDVDNVSQMVVRAVLSYTY